MEAKNFRIGNLIEVEGKIIEIGMIKEKFISWNVAKYPENRVWNPFIPVNDKRLKGIEINKSKLEQLGFEITPLTNGRNRATKWKIDLFEDEKGIWSFDLGRIYIDINFLHELQNLFFALTGTELELKQEVSACS